MPVGGLIGKVDNSAPFPIGSHAQPIVMPADGRLMLGVNENVCDQRVELESVFLPPLEDAGRVIGLEDL